MLTDFLNTYIPSGLSAPESPAPPPPHAFKMNLKSTQAPYHSPQGAGMIWPFCPTLYMALHLLAGSLCPCPHTHQACSVLGYAVPAPCTPECFAPRSTNNDPFPSGIHPLRGLQSPLYHIRCFPFFLKDSLHLLADDPDYIYFKYSRREGVCWEKPFLAHS